MDDMSKPGGYDYAALDKPAAALAQQAAGTIKEKVRRAAQDIVDIGAALIAVKAALPHGAFSDWLAVEFSWNERQARRFMNVAETFKTDNLSDLQIAPSALYALAAPSTPESAREEVLQQASAGQRVSHQSAKETIARHKEPRQRERVADEELFPEDSPVSPAAHDDQAAGAGATGGDQSGVAVLLSQDEETDNALEVQRRIPPDAGYMRIRIVTGSYEDAQRAKDVLLQALGSGKYTEPRESNREKYEGSYRVYSREDVQIALAAQPAQQPVDSASPMEVAALRTELQTAQQEIIRQRAQIAGLQGDNDRLREESAKAQAESKRAYDHMSKTTPHERDTLRVDLREAQQEIKILSRREETTRQALEAMRGRAIQAETQLEVEQRKVEKHQQELQAAKTVSGKARAIFEEYRESVSKAQQYKPTSARGEAVAPLLRAIERVWLLLQDSSRDD